MHNKLSWRNEEIASYSGIPINGYYRDMKNLSFILNIYDVWKGIEYYNKIPKNIYVSFNNFTWNIRNVSMTIFLWSCISRKRTRIHWISAFYCLKKSFGSTTLFNGYYWGSTLSITTNKTRLTLKLCDMDLDCNT